jgi:hypothetical protein
MKILYPFANVMGLHFPVGKLEDGGTCQFITDKCYEECCCNYLPDVTMGVEIKIKKKVYRYFLDNSPEKVAKQMAKELSEADCNILSWFASGDCPSMLTNKFHSVVKILDKSNIIQTGFTRNKTLWKKCKQLSPSCKVLFTIEDIKDTDDDGLYSLPNYEIGAIDIVHIADKKTGRFITVGCGGGYYEHQKKIMGKDNSHLKLDCRACYKDKTGCFWTIK